MAEQATEGVQFEISIVGDESGETWAGKFRAKEKVTFQDQIQADRMRREMLGLNSHEADPEVQGQVMMLAELSVRLTETPKWWQEMRNGFGLADLNVLMAIYKECVRVRKEYVNRVKKNGEDAVKKLGEEK
jgi:hypothetical protein